MHSAELLTLISSPLLILLVLFGVRWSYQKAGRSVSPLVLGAIGILWFGVPSVLANAGVLANFSIFPAPFMVVTTLLMVVTIVVGCSRLMTPVVRHLGLWILVAYQAFRIIPELILYLSHHQGVTPIQMTFEGWNFDIATALLAIPVAWICAKKTESSPAARRLVLCWNIVGLFLLATIIGIAIVSLPTPLRLFHNEPANVGMGTYPLILIPTAQVCIALLGHIIVFRKLRYLASGPSS